MIPSLGFDVSLRKLPGKIDVFFSMLLRNRISIRSDFTRDTMLGLPADVIVLVAGMCMRIFPCIFSSFVSSIFVSRSVKRRNHFEQGYCVNGYSNCHSEYFFAIRRSQISHESRRVNSARIDSCLAEYL
jgi:hypothetical protein